MDLRRLRPNAFTSRVTRFSPSELWPFVSDPSLLVAFSSELQAVRVLSDPPVGLGTIFEGDQRRGERTWISLSTVTAFEAPWHFAWTVGDLECPVSSWRFLVDGDDRGSTLTHQVELLGGSSPMSEYILANPADADRVIHERLDELRQRMSITVDGLLGLAGDAG